MIIKKIFTYPLSPPKTYNASFQATRVCLLRLESETKTILHVEIHEKVIESRGFIDFFYKCLLMG